MNMKVLGIVNDMPRGWYRGENQPLWHYKVYYMWKDMWKRCRNPNDINYKDYKDCKIYEDFKYLSKYVEWIISEPRFEEFCETCDKISWSVDKDSKKHNNKNYYPQYMTLTTRSENSKERINRGGTPNPKAPVIAIDSDKILLFKSMLDAQDKGFDQGAISKCINKSHHYKTHKGYRWYKINYKYNLRLRKIKFKK